MQTATEDTRQNTYLHMLFVMVYGVPLEEISPKLDLDITHH